MIVNISSEDAIEIAFHINAEYYFLSKIDGKPIIKIKNLSYWDYYRKYIKAEICRSMYDNIGSYINPPITIEKDDDYILIKILEYDSELFNHNIREEKLKRILNNE